MIYFSAQNNRRRSSHYGYAARSDDLNGYGDYNYRDLDRVVPYIDSWAQEYER